MSYCSEEVQSSKLRIATLLQRKSRATGLSRLFYSVQLSFEFNKLDSLMTTSNKGVTWNE